MRHRYSVAVLTLAAVVLAYLASDTPVKAQDASLPFVTGDTISLRFGSGSTGFTVGETYNCAVTGIRGTFVRCAPAPRRIGLPEPPELWFNMQSVVAVVIER